VRVCLPPPLTYQGKMHYTPATLTCATTCLQDILSHRCLPHATLHAAARTRTHARYPYRTLPHAEGEQQHLHLASSTSLTTRLGHDLHMPSRAPARFARRYPATPFAFRYLPSPSSYSVANDDMAKPAICATVPSFQYSISHGWRMPCTAGVDRRKGERCHCHALPIPSVLVLSLPGLYRPDSPSSPDA